MDDEADDVPFRKISPATAGWYSDPTARHESRYWDGTGWTDQVSDHGRSGHDESAGLRMVPRSRPWWQTALYVIGIIVAILCVLVLVVIGLCFASFSR